MRGERKKKRALFIGEIVTLPGSRRSSQFTTAINADELRGFKAARLLMKTSQRHPHPRSPFHLAHWAWTGKMCPVWGAALAVSGKKGSLERVKNIRLLRRRRGMSLVEKEFNQSDLFGSDIWYRLATVANQSSSLKECTTVANLQLCKTPPTPQKRCQEMVSSEILHNC